MPLSNLEGVVVISSVGITNLIGDAFEYRFWSVGQRVTIRSPYAIHPGDPIKIVRLNEEDRIIDVVPDSVEITAGTDVLVLAIFANHIPLSADDEYEIKYNKCTPLIQTTVLDGRGNKFLVFCCLTHNVDASVYGICHEHDDRFIFSIHYQNSSLVAGDLFDELMAKVEKSVRESDD